MTISTVLTTTGRLASRRTALTARGGVFASCRIPTTNNTKRAVAAALSSTLSSSSNPRDVGLLASRHHQQHHNNKLQSPNHFVRYLSTSNDDDNKDKDQDATTPPPPSSSNDDTDNNLTVGETVSMEFKAETRQLLDIVTNSLYSEKEVFLRELISNSSDALEKLRQLQLNTSADRILHGADVPLEIRLDVDEVASTITITDTGIGMTREDLVSNLGTIARSGSKAFVQELERNFKNDTGTGTAPELDLARGIIGRFGVGFYSVFMVAHKVEVRSKPALLLPQSDGDGDSNEGSAGREAPATVWSSDGTGTFQVAELSPDVRQDRGTSIVIHLHSDYWHLCNEQKLTDLLRNYSNFVPFPIVVHGKRINTIQAVWSQDPKEVPHETHSEFYKYIANAIDDPIDYVHFRADAPVDIKAVLYIPSFHSEKYGMGRMEPGVGLYCRKILIESKCKDIVPDWMRFVKGVVDSEDLPLAISREKPQQAALLTKLRTVVTRKFLSHLEKMAKKEKDKYLDEFYREYSFFLKEGLCQDYGFQAQLAKLLYFESNKNVSQKLQSFDDYIANMRPEQKDIYYLCAPSREVAAMSPYLEAFERANVEVIFIYSAIDDFVMANLEKYEGRNLVSVEKGDIDLSALTNDDDDNDGKKKKKKKEDGKDAESDSDSDDEDDEDDNNQESLDATQAMDFCLWMKDAVGQDKIATCRPSNRLVSSPAIVTDHESGSMRRMMRLVDTSGDTGLNRESMPLPKQHVEINPKHPIIVGIAQIKDKEPVLARVLAEQVYDNCLVAAGLLDDSRTMLPRLNDLLVALVRGAQLNGKENDNKSEK